MRAKHFLMRKTGVCSGCDNDTEDDDVCVPSAAILLLYSSNLAHCHSLTLNTSILFVQNMEKKIFPKTLRGGT